MTVSLERSAETTERLCGRTGAAPLSKQENFFWENRPQADLYKTAPTVESRMAGAFLREEKHYGIPHSPQDG